MYWSNYHSHCSFCDGKSSMADFILFAIAKNIKNYGFSSHAPLPFFTHWTMLASDFPDYHLEFERYKEKYKDQINLFLGLEIDFIEDFSSEIDAFLKDKKLDYLISSIHYLDKLSNGHYWTIDGPFEEFDEGLKELFRCDIKAATRKYYEVVNKMIDKGGFDIVGHVDKITLHGRHYRDFDHKQSWYKKLIGETFQKIKDKGLILEINTKSLPEKDFTYPNKYFFPLMKELNIPIIVNSDCHYPNLITAGFEQTYADLKKAGFSSMQELREGNWVEVEFDERGIKG